MKARRPPRRTRPWLAALSLLVWGAGCQILVDGELAVIHCQAEGAMGPPACPEGQICTSGSCVEKIDIVPALGAPCLDDGDCTSGDFCLDPGKFGETGPKHCSRACCISSDCEPLRGFVCWMPLQGGGGHCRAASEVGRATPGTARAGESCDRGEDCLSGLCDATTYSCADSCCSTTNCSATNTSCRWGDTTQPIPGFACSSPKGTGSPLEGCAVHEGCISGLCIDFSDGVKRCAAPCCNSGSCGAIVENNAASPVACIDIEHEGTHVRACAGLLPPTATKAVGERCTTDEECRGGVCDLAADGTRYCSDACCTDGSCGDQDLFACVPTRWNDAWGLRCAPK